MKAENLTGRKFGRLLVIQLLASGRHGTLWKCRCSCGKSKDVYASALRTGRTVSCGCYHDECSRNRTTHGESGTTKRTAEYRTWYAMKQRCLNSNTKQYKDYGGRGITVCARWMWFEDFLTDMGRKPTPAHTIERINNELSYFKKNCKWATRKEQSANRRVSKREDHTTRPK